MDLNDMVLAVALLLAQSQVSVDTYGKTEAEILKMGPKSWYTFYTSKAGESTYGMSNASGIYADVAAKRNNRLLADPKTPHRHELQKIATLLTRFGGNMVSLGEQISGGGTMWGPIGNSSYADGQDTIYALIHPSGQPKAKATVVSEVTKKLAEVPGLLSKGADYLTNTQKKQVLINCAEAKALYAKIVAYASHCDRATSDRILSYCVGQAQYINVAE